MKLIGLIWIATGAWLLFDQANATQFYLSNTPLFAILSIVSGYSIINASKEKRRNLR